MGVKFYAALVLALIIGQFLLDVILDGLNLRSFPREVPAEFRDLVDSERNVKARAYQKEHFRVAVLREGILTLWLLVFIGFGGFNGTDLFARSFGYGPIATGLIFTAVLLVIRGLLQIPFSLYSTFVIEEKYGFNRMTPATFLGDLAKGVLLSIVIGAPALAAILWFFEAAGDRAWIYAWIAVSAFQIGLTFLAPAVIMPLFNKFTPIENDELKRAIDDYIRSQDFKISGVYTMDGSKRSTKANAFFTGFGKLRRLVLFDTLVQKQSKEELMAVLAHEVGHYKRQHIPKFVALSVASTGVLFFVLSRVLGNRDLFDAFRMALLSTYGGLMIVSVLFGPVSRFLSLFTHWLSRKFEFESDEYSVRTYGKPEALISALKKLSVDHLANLTPHPLKVAFDYTHPPVIQRIAALRRSQMEG